MLYIEMRKRVKRSIKTKTESNPWILLHHTRKGCCHVSTLKLPWSISYLSSFSLLLFWSMSFFDYLSSHIVQSVYSASQASQVNIIIIIIKKLLKNIFGMCLSFKDTYALVYD